MRKEYIDLLNNLIDLLKILLPTFSATYFAYRYGMKRLRNQQSLRFIERQLREFYSPMVRCVKKIKVISELIFEISKNSNPAWRKICDEHPAPFIDHDKYFEPFKKSIMYNNKQFHDEVIPLYEKMVSIFTENLELANSSTKKWFPELWRFVDLWHRWLEKSIPKEVLEEMDHTEERLKPLYQDLENQLEELKKELSGK